MRIHMKLKSTSYTVLAVFSVSFLCMCYILVWRWNDLKELHNSILQSNKVRKFSIPELMGSSNVFEVVQPNISTIISEPSIPFIKRGDEKQRPFAVIVVTSMAKCFNQRHATRSTWYRWADELNIRVFFMIGFHDFEKKELFHLLEEEQRKYDDLIIDEYEEGYYKLAGKVLRMLKWYNATYSEENAPRFFVKTDQDVFINLPNLVTVLNNTTYYKNMVSLSPPDRNSTSLLLSDAINLSYDPSDPETYFIGGKRFENPKVEADPNSKWYIDSSEREKLSWSASHYPTYTNGPCYVISGNVVSAIYEASFSVPIYPFEDVYIVGMIAYDRLNLYISNLKEMWLDKSFFSYVTRRSKLKKMLAIHPVDHPSIMIKICKRIHSCKRHLQESFSGAQTPTNLQCVLVILIGLTLNNVFKIY